MLIPSERQILNFELEADDLASFYTDSSSWIVEPGEYQLMVGTSSQKIKQVSSFQVKEQLNAGKVSKALQPNKKVEWLKR